MICKRLLLQIVVCDGGGGKGDVQTVHVAIVLLILWLNFIETYVLAATGCIYSVNVAT